MQPIKNQAKIVNCLRPVTCAPSCSCGSDSCHPVDTVNNLNNASAANEYLTLPGPDGTFRLPVSLLELSFVNSPFYKVLDVMVPPTVMCPEMCFTPGRRAYDRSLTFSISSDQAETITYHSHRVSDRMEFGVQVIMRFGKLEASDFKSPLKEGNIQFSLAGLEPFSDSLPVHLTLRVNGRNASLPPILPSNRPGMDGRRNSRPINLTPLLRVSPVATNHIKLAWTHEYASYVYNFFALYLVRKRSTKELCEALRVHSWQLASITQQQIIKKLAESHSPEFSSSVDDDLVMQNILPVQLLCPLSKCRIDLPVRGLKCEHIQCYDANTYLLINERKPCWKCPVCDNFAPFYELVVDGLMAEILSSKAHSEVDEIIFNEDGSWSIDGVSSSMNMFPGSSKALPEHSSTKVFSFSSPYCSNRMTNQFVSNTNNSTHNCPVTRLVNNASVRVLKSQPPRRVPSPPLPPQKPILCLTSPPSLYNSAQGIHEAEAAVTIDLTESDDEATVIPHIQNKRSKLAFPDKPSPTTQRDWVRATVLSLKSPPTSSQKSPLPQTSIATTTSGGERSTRKRARPASAICSRSPHHLLMSSQLESPPLPPTAGRRVSYPAARASVTRVLPAGWSSPASTSSLNNGTNMHFSPNPARGGTTSSTGWLQTPTFQTNANFHNQPLTDSQLFNFAGGCCNAASHVNSLNEAPSSNAPIFSTSQLPTAYYSVVPQSYCPNIQPFQPSPGPCCQSRASLFSSDLSTGGSWVNIRAQPPGHYYRPSQLQTTFWPPGGSVRSILRTGQAWQSTKAADGYVCSDSQRLLHPPQAMDPRPGWPCAPPKPNS